MQTQKNAKKNTKTLYMAIKPNQKLPRTVQQLPIFWKGSKAKAFADKIHGKKTRVTLSW